MPAKARCEDVFAKGSKDRNPSKQQIPFGDDNQKSNGDGADWGADWWGAFCVIVRRTDRVPVTPP